MRRSMDAHRNRVQRKGGLLAQFISVAAALSRTLSDTSSGLNWMWTSAKKGKRRIHALYCPDVIGFGIVPIFRLIDPQ